MRPTKSHSNNSALPFISVHEGGICKTDILLKKEIYLDVKDHKTSTHIEGLLKSLGAKSRVEEMLKRVKDQPSLITIDPLYGAVEKGIAILSVEEAQQLIKKFCTSEHAEVRVLRSPYLKVDVLHSFYQPVLNEFLRGWPAIKISGSGCAFVSTNRNVNFSLHFSSTETRKGREYFQLHQERNIEAKCCEQVAADIIVENCAKNISCTIYESSKKEQEHYCAVKGHQELPSVPCSTALVAEQRNESDVNVSSVVVNHEIKNLNADNVIGSESRTVALKCDYEVHEEHNGEGTFDSVSCISGHRENLENAECMLNIHGNLGDNASMPIRVNNVLSLQTSCLSTYKIGACSLRSSTACCVTVKLTENVKVCSWLQMPVRPPRSGKLYVYLPEHKEFKKCGVIHIALNGESEPLLPDKTFCVGETYFHVLSACHFPKPFAHDFLVVTGGTGVYISSGTALGRYQSLAHYSPNACDCHMVKGKVQGDAKEYIQDGEAEEQSVLLKVISLQLDDTIAGKQTLTDTKSILIQVLEPNYLDSQRNCVKINAYVRDWKPYSQEYSNILIPCVNVGILEVVISFVKWAIEIRHFEEWFESCGELNRQCGLTGISIGAYRCKSLTFELLSSEQADTDVALQTIFHEAIENVINECSEEVKKIACVCEFDVRFPVKVFGCCDAGICGEAQTEAFRKSEVILDKSNTEVFKRPVNRILKGVSNVSLHGVNGEQRKIFRFRDLPGVSLHTRKIVDPVRGKSKKLQYGKDITTVESVQSVQSVERPTLFHMQRKAQRNYEKNSSTEIDVSKWSSVNKCHSSQSESVSQKHELLLSAVKPVSNVPGYCEICNCEYTSLAKHAAEISHRHFFLNARHFEELDQYMSTVNSSSVLRGIWNL